MVLRDKECVVYQFLDETDDQPVRLATETEQFVTGLSLKVNHRTLDELSKRPNGQILLANLLRVSRSRNCKLQANVRDELAKTPLVESVSQDGRVQINAKVRQIMLACIKEETDDKRGCKRYVVVHGRAYDIANVLE